MLWEAAAVTVLGKHDIWVEARKSALNRFDDLRPTRLCVPELLDVYGKKESWSLDEIDRVIYRRCERPIRPVSKDISTKDG